MTCKSDFEKVVADFAAEFVTAGEELATAVTALATAKTDLTSATLAANPYKDPIVYRTSKSRTLVTKQLDLADLVKEIDDLKAELTGDTDKDKSK